MTCSASNNHSRSFLSPLTALPCFPPNHNFSYTWYPTPLDDPVVTQRSSKAMLTNKQRYRRICGAQLVGRSLGLPIGSNGYGTSPTPLRRSQLGWPPNMMRPSLDSLTIGDSLLHLKCNSGQRSQENDNTCASMSQQKSRPRVQGRVHFNFQVRVVLVPSRSELDRLKADIWWGEKDYISFRSVLSNNIEWSDRVKPRIRATCNSSRTIQFEGKLLYVVQQSFTSMTFNGGFGGAWNIEVSCSLQLVHLVRSCYSPIS